LYCRACLPNVWSAAAQGLLAHLSKTCRGLQHMVDFTLLGTCYICYKEQFLHVFTCCSCA
jgi:hypothetical protein